MDFFKKVSDGVSQKATDVSATMRLNSQIKSKEEELHKTLQSLGETYYNNAKEGTEGDYTALIARVDELKGEIASCKEQLIDLKGMIQCPKCGAELEKGAKFCVQCGYELPVPVKKVCADCGAELQEGAKFCTKCGTKVEE